MQCCEWCAVRKQESNAVSGIRCDVTKRAGVIIGVAWTTPTGPASHWTKCIAGVILEGCMAGETLRVKRTSALNCAEVFALLHMAVRTVLYK
jgi:hypothetical protein